MTGIKSVDAEGAEEMQERAQRKTERNVVTGWQTTKPVHAD